jgi:energy-coupling factor transport system ATP-binding protein
MGLTEDEVKERTLEAAGFVGLGESFMQKSPFELSGGEKRRAAIAGVIAMRPEILILDEPTAGLDPGGQSEIIKNIKNYKKARNATIILVTHNMEEIAKNAERIVVLNKGEVQQDAPPSEVFANSEKLINLGLAAPKAALIAERLRASGVEIKQEIYTLEQLKTEIIRLRQDTKRGTYKNA